MTCLEAAFVKPIHCFVFIIFFLPSFLPFIMAALSLCCCMDFSLVVVNGSYSLVAGCGLLTAVASLLQSTGYRVHGLQ